MKPRLPLLALLALLVSCGRAPSDSPTAPALSPDGDASPSTLRRAAGSGDVVAAAPRIEVIEAPVQVNLVEPRDDNVVVQLQPGTDAQALAALLGLTLVHYYEPAHLALFEIQADDEVGDLFNTPGVADYGVNDPVYLLEGQDLVFGFNEGEWDEGENEGQDAFLPLELPLAHQLATGIGVKIAHLDTGIDDTHPHLQGFVELLSGEELTSIETQNGIDDDGDGLIDEAFGHGTHTAGIARSVAPEATLLPIRVLSDEGIGSLWDFLLGLDIARRHGADVINLSLSLSPPSRLVQTQLAALSAEGIVVVAAAGNDGLRNPVYPAVSPYTLGVAAVEPGDILAEFSGGGPVIALAAPGVSVLSSYPGGLQAYATGTSMSTPMGAGVIALAQQGLGITTVEAAQRVCLTAVTIDPALGTSHGRVSPVGALMYAGREGPSIHEQH